MNLTPAQKAAVRYYRALLQNQRRLGTKKARELGVTFPVQAVTNRLARMGLLTRAAWNNGPVWDLTEVGWTVEV